MGYVIHPREEWIDDVPWDHTINGKGEYYVCPPFHGWPVIRDIVIHYPGADFADMDFNNDGKVDPSDTRQVIQQMHKAYLMGSSRGYSLGYCFIIGQTGDIWESRGVRNTNAANLGDKEHNHVGWNNYSVSVQLVVDDQDAATQAQVDACNWLLDEFTKFKGSPLNLKYHGMGQSTSCAGTGIINQVKTGAIAFSKATPPPPKPEPIPGVDNMSTTLFKPFDCDAQFIGQTDGNGVAVSVVWVDKQRADAHVAAGARIDDKLSLGGFTNCVLLGPLPVGDTRHAWSGAEFFRVVT